MPAEQLEVVAGFERLAALRADPAGFEAELAGLQGRIQALAEARGEYEKVPLELRYYRLKLLDYSQYGFVLSFLLMAFHVAAPAESRSVRGHVAGGGRPHGAGQRGDRVPLPHPRPAAGQHAVRDGAVRDRDRGAIVALFIEAVNRQRIALSAGAILGVVGLFISKRLRDARQEGHHAVPGGGPGHQLLAGHARHVDHDRVLGGAAGGVAGQRVPAGDQLFGCRSRGDARPSTGRLGPDDLRRCICFGLLFSVIGTILGGIWANDSWGRFWGWDPKENGALLIVLSQIAILHGRAGGYLRTHGVCMAAALGGTVIAFSWWGVNLLGVGLHSYGFTSGIHQRSGRILPAVGHRRPGRGGLDPRASTAGGTGLNGTLGS